MADDDNYADDTYAPDEPDGESENVDMSSALMRREEDDGGMVPLSTSGGLSSMHAGYLTHIRALQRTNGALSKKVANLTALQSEHTRMKLIARQQRLLREKQLLLDSLAELILSRGVMSADDLATHLQTLIEQGALDQPNPGKIKKELLDSKRDQQRMMAEMAKLRKQVRTLEAAHVEGGQAQERQTGGNAAASVRSQAARAELQHQSDADRAAHAQLSAEFLALSSQHTALQSSHHSLTLSLTEHKKLVESVTEENRSLRGYLTQWEASEERRILAEQQVLLLQESAARAVGERENTFQEMRSFRHKVLALAEAKARGEEEAATAIAAARRAEQAARDHAAALVRQLDLLKADVRANADVVEWHRAQNVLHLTVDAQEGARAKEKAHAEEITQLQAERDAWQQKYTLLLQKEGEEMPHHRVASFALLQENAHLRSSVALLESRFGTLVAQSETDAAAVREATDARKQADTELAVLQRALQQMAIDLQALQRAHHEKSAALQHAVEVKIPRMRLQRSNLAAACQRQNEAIQELAAQLQLQQHSTGGSAGDSGQVSSRRQARDAKYQQALAAAAAEIDGTADQSHNAGRDQRASRSSAKAARSTNSATAPQTVANAVERAGAAVKSLFTTSVDAAIEQQFGHNDSADNEYADDIDADADADAAASSSAQQGDAYAADAMDMAADASYAPATSTAEPSANSAAAGSGEEWVDPAGVWVRCVTENGQAYYFYNQHTGESVWLDPLISTNDEPTSSTEAAASSSATEGGSAAAAAAASAAPSHRSVQNSDLELTPLPSERTFGFDLPDLSARPAQPPVQEEGEDDAYGEESGAQSQAYSQQGTAADTEVPEEEF